MRGQGLSGIFSGSTLIILICGSSTTYHSLSSKLHLSIGDDAYKSKAFEETTSFIFETPSIDVATNGRLKAEDLISQTCELQVAQQIVGSGF